VGVKPRIGACARGIKALSVTHVRRIWIKQHMNKLHNSGFIQRRSLFSVPEIQSTGSSGRPGGQHVYKDHVRRVTTAVTPRG
jgi:hypothetical protein